MSNNYKQNRRNVESDFWSDTNDQCISLVGSTLFSKSENVTNQHYVEPEYARQNKKPSCTDLRGKSKDPPILNVKSPRKKKKKKKPRQNVFPLPTEAVGELIEKKSCQVNRPPKANQPSSSQPSSSVGKGTTGGKGIEIILKHIDQKRRQMIAQLKQQLSARDSPDRDDFVEETVTDSPKHSARSAKASDDRRLSSMRNSSPGPRIPKSTKLPAVMMKNGAVFDRKDAVVLNKTLPERQSASATRSLLRTFVGEYSSDTACPKEGATLNEDKPPRKILKATRHLTSSKKTYDIFSLDSTPEKTYDERVSHKKIRVVSQNSAAASRSHNAELEISPDTSLKKLVNSKELSESDSVDHRVLYHAGYSMLSRSTQPARLDQSSVEQPFDSHLELRGKRAKPCETVVSPRTSQQANLIKQQQISSPRSDINLNQSSQSPDDDLGPEASEVPFLREVHALISAMNAAHEADLLSSSQLQQTRSSQNAQKLERLPYPTRSARTKPYRDSLQNIHRSTSARDLPSSQQLSAEVSVTKRPRFTPRQILSRATKDSAGGFSDERESPSKASEDVEDSYDVEMTDVSADLQSLDVLKEPDTICADSKDFCIVIDTSVLMDDLKLVDEIKDFPLRGSGSLHVVIPWIVIQELDGLKHVPEKRKPAGEAVRYLYNMLNSRHPRFHGQTAKMAAKCEELYDKCNDDLVLGCSLQLSENMPKERIILLSNDINLCNKAIINGITAHTVSSLKDALKSQVDSLHKVLSLKTSTDGESQFDTGGDLIPEPPDCLKELDIILCETKMLLKFALEPYLEEAMLEAFGDVGKRFLPDPPAVLSDILDCYNRCWISVFGLKLPVEVKEPLEHLAQKFGIHKRYTFDVKSTLQTLKDAEIVCKAMVEIKPSVEPCLKRISVLLEQCRSLGGPEQTTEKAEEKKSVEGDIKKEENNAIVLAVFNHLWALISHLCGLTLTSVGIPHDFVYNKPEEMPSLADFQLLLSNLFPQVHKLRKAMIKLLRSPSEDESENDKEFRNFYNYLMQFVPSLEIQASPPPTDNFTVERLRLFFQDDGNKELLKNGVNQLETFYLKLNECIHHAIWKGGDQSKN